MDTEKIMNNMMNISSFSRRIPRRISFDLHHFL